MFFALRELELRKIPFATTYAPGQIEFLDQDLQQRTALEASGVAELKGPVQEIRIHGHLRGTVACGCDRCLEPMEVVLDGGFDLQYWPPDAGWEEHESGLSRDDTGIGYYEGAGLDLADVVREQVLLWLPMQRVCREGCKGICPSCGQNRNVAACSCAPRQVDDRWQALTEL